MTRRVRISLGVLCLVLVAGGVGWAQRQSARPPAQGASSFDLGLGDLGLEERSSPLPADRAAILNWENNTAFDHDEFTFARLIYSQSGRSRFGSQRGGRGGRSRGGRNRSRQFTSGGYSGYGSRNSGPYTDYPDSDDNFSFRLQQLTSLKVNPRPVDVTIIDPELFNYPFVYMIEVATGGLYFYPDEVEILRRYLENGGFLMVDDFWGVEAYWYFYAEIKKVFPDREPVDLELDHPIFHTVYDIKEKPQVPNIRTALNGLSAGITWEREDARTPEYKAILDDDGRIMVLICHNTDLGDGWEREGVDERYFREFSEKKAYPMGINIVVYALTH